MRGRELADAVLDMELFMFGGEIMRSHTFAGGGGDFVTPQSRDWSEGAGKLVDESADTMGPTYVRIVGPPGTTPRVRFERRG